MSAEGPRVQGLAEADPLASEDLGRELRHRWLIWDEFVGGRRRVDLHPLILPAQAHDDARSAAEDAVRLVGQAATLALEAREERAEAARYGFSRAVERLAEASFRAGDTLSLVRVDLLLGEDGRFRACEVNADCPGGHNEAHGLPWLARRAGFHGASDVTAVIPELASCLVALSGGPGSPEGLIALVFATAYAEDLQVCALIERAVLEAGGRAVRVPPTALRVQGGRVFTGASRVGVLYRFFPTEHFAELPLAEEIVPCIESGSVRTLSSFSAMYLQSKLAFARAHSVASSLSPRDLQALQSRVPYSCLPVEAEGLEGDKDGWVLKRALGRVGDEVFVGALFERGAWSRIVQAVREAVARGEVWIAQRFVPQRPVPTPWGPRLVTLGVYLMEGRFLGYFARLTEVSHASHDALVLPVFVAPRGPSAARSSPLGDVQGRP